MFKVKAVYLFMSLMAVLFFACISEATQVMTFKPGASEMVEVSSKNLNVLKMPSSDIKVITSSTNIDIKVLGENVLAQFTDGGQPAELVFISKKGVYTLTLIPRGIPSETVILKEESFEKEESHAWETTQPYVTVLKEVIKAMYKGDVPPGYKVDRIDKVIEPKWDKTILKHVARYYGANIIGDVYELKNLGQQKMVIKPQEFYEKNVLASSIDREEINPGEWTMIFVLRQASSEKSPIKSIQYPLN